MFGVVALYILAITYLFAAIGLAASSPDAASGYGFILLFLPYVSSAFVPVETMPEWLQWIAENQPITPVIETIRGLLHRCAGHAERREVLVGGRSRRLARPRASSHSRRGGVWLSPGGPSRGAAARCGCRGRTSVSRHRSGRAAAHAPSTASALV